MHIGSIDEKIISQSFYRTTKRKYVIIMSEQNRKKLCDKIDMLIKDEHDANVEYQKFADGFQGKDEFEDQIDTLSDMSNDEGGHHENLVQMKKDLKC